MWGPGNEAECGGLGMRLGVKGEYGGPGNEAGSEGCVWGAWE